MNPKAALVAFEKSKLAAQLFRVARISAAGLVAYTLTHNGVDSAIAVAIVEAAFRQVFPSPGP